MGTGPGPDKFAGARAADGKDAAANLIHATFSAEPPTIIGMRRAPLETWPALPMYVLALEDMPAEARPRTPLRVTLEWDKTERPGMQTPRIVRATDVDGIDLASDEITLRLQTLGRHAASGAATDGAKVNGPGGDAGSGAGSGHWLDTGVLAIA